MPIFDVANKVLIGREGVPCAIWNDTFIFAGAFVDVCPSKTTLANVLG